MCGIFAVVNDQTNRAGETVLQGLKKLEYRGYDSWGIALKIKSSKSKVKSQKLFVKKRVGKISQAKTNLPSGVIAIGHTRWATHGGVTNKNAHPHLDCTGKIAVVHNGIVENYQQLKQRLKKAGHKFISETDTEIIAHLIEEESKTKDIVRAVFSTFSQLTGPNAIGVLDLDREMIISCRYGSPVFVGVGKREYFLASDVTPFLAKTNKVVFINDGEGVVLTKKGVKLFDWRTGKKKKISIEMIDWKLEEAQKSGYPHFLLKEIMEQKIIIPKTANLNKKEIKNLAQKIREGWKVAMFACGTALYCALAAKYFFVDVGVETQVYGAYEFLPFAQFCDKKTIAIAVSQSGETADTLIAAKKAKTQGAYLVAVVNAPGSTLERMADCVLKVGAGPEIAVVSTKAFTSQLATLYLLAQAVIKRYSQGQEKIKKLGRTLVKWLNKKLQNQVITLAKSLMDSKDIYILGKYLNYSGALEFALKIKETSYIHSEAFASGELKHGVISLIQKGTPCIVLGSNDETKQEILSSAAEIKARGGRIIGVAPFKAQEFDDFIKTPDIGELTVFCNVVVGQLLGYLLGVGRGADPDKPRNLAKSVTVK